MPRAIRREPRGFDEQWAANAAEIERWRSVDHGKARELHAAAPERRSHGDSRHRGRRPARRGAFTVIAGGLAVGGLLLYLLITLSGIGPPKQFTQQTEVPTQAAPVDATGASPRKATTAPMTLEERRREEEKRTARAHPGNVIRHAAAALLPATEPPPGGKDEAWQRFYQPSESCRANESRGTIACANEYARARMDFESRWAEGRL